MRVVADFVFVIKAMALARDHEVVIAVGAQFYRALQSVRGYRSGASPEGRLRFLAAKSTPHAAATNVHLMRLPAQRMGDDLLHFARVLGGTMHVHGAALLWQGVGDLPF